MSRHRLSRADRAKRDTRLQPEEEPEFQIAPMIDILLVLLVFFMSISSTEVLQVNQEISLPVAKDAKSAGSNPDQMIINVTWNQFGNEGGIEIDERNYPTPTAIIGDLRKNVVRNPTMRVLVRADRGVRYEYMREILRSVGDAGVANVTFSVVDKDATQP
jgi:biopolymer transport protein ExbD